MNNVESTTVELVTDYPTTNLVQFRKATFSKNKLTLDHTITLTEWRDLGLGLKQIEGNVQFWLADWIKYGDERGFTSGRVSGQVYDHLEDITGYSRQALTDINYVGESVGSRRREDLSFSHHREVAPLEPAAQEELLQKAASQKLSVRELREEVKKTKSEKQEGVLTLQRINDQLDWEKELKEMAKMVNSKYKKEQRIFFKNLIKS